jgi:hypothetical protein
MPFSHVIGFDDSPFQHNHRGGVAIVGTMYAGLRLDGILAGRVQRDGVNATPALVQLVARSKWAGQVQLIMLQGIALGGFNVVDAYALHDQLGVPVLVVARHAPDLPAIKNTLLTHVRGGARKWALIERLGPMEPVAGVWVQRVGLSLAEADALLARLAIHGRIPEPLRVAHLITGGVTTGQSRGRA